MIIECSNVTKSFQGELLLKNITFTIKEKERIAIVGVNGAGKTTILKILDDQLEIDSGNIFKAKDISIGYLRQEHNLDMSKTIYQSALDIFDSLIVMEQSLRSLEQRMGENFNDEVMNQYDRLSHQFSELGGYMYLSKIEGVLKGVGFTKEEFNMVVSTLSGGQKTRLSLAKLLLQEPKLLLLDEPTNHLDANAIRFLEGYLKGYPHSIIFVSHDRYFIDQVANTIVEVENGKSKVYNCMYHEYSIRKQQLRAIELKQYVNQQREIAKAQASIDLLKSFNREKSVRRAMSKEKQLSKIERIDKPESLPESISMSFTPRLESGHEVVKVKDVAIGYSDILSKNIDFTIVKNQRIALVGQNGIGKTTLFKAIMKVLQPMSGKITLGSKIDIGYYDQEHTSLSLSSTIFNEISDAYPKMTNTEIRSILAMFNFKGDDVFKELSVLSGGEKGRVVLAKLLLQQANFLLLDEPTNHLDIASKEVLEQALVEFKGTIFFISHDRYFINKIATDVYELTPDGVITYAGNYDNYISKKIVVEETKKETVTVSKVKQVIDRKQRNEIKKVEKEITRLEEEIETLQNKLQDPSIIDDYLVYNETTDAITSLEIELETQLEKWQELHEA